MPSAFALAERACDRWTASSIICGVAEVGFFTVVVGVGVVVGVVVWADADSAKGTTPTTPTPINLRIVLNFFIVISSCWALSRSRSRIALRQDLRRCEDDTVGGWVGSRRDCGLRRARYPSQELDAHQQSEILVHRVVAMVDIGSAIFSELYLERD